MIVKFEDSYQSGVPINLIVYNGGENCVPKIGYNLPDGTRLFTTFKDYDHNIKFMFEHEGKWRNYANLKKREKMGITDAEISDMQEYIEFKKQWHEEEKRRKEK